MKGDCDHIDRTAGAALRVALSITAQTEILVRIFEKIESFSHSYFHWKVSISGKILAVRGYDSVGRTISITLGNPFPGRVIAAGRNYARARELASARKLREWLPARST